MEPLLILQSTEDVNTLSIIVMLITFPLTLCLMIFSIVLYIKLWGATNDIRKIRKMLEERFGKAEEE